MMEAWGGRETRPLTEVPNEEPDICGDIVRVKEGYWMDEVPFANEDVGR